MRGDPCEHCGGTGRVEYLPYSKCNHERIVRYGLKARYYRMIECPVCHMYIKIPGVGGGNLTTFSPRCDPL